MYILENAIKSITRAKGRNILIFILILIIAISACISLSIKNSADIAKEATYESLSITAQIGVDREKIMGEGGYEDKDEMREVLSYSLSIDELQTYEEIEVVENFYYQGNIGLNVSDDMEIYETSSSSMMMPREGNSSDLQIVGYSSHDAMTSFIEGENVIYEGSMFDESSSDNSAVISYELATLNDLSVGDSFSVYNPNQESETYTFIISGLFENELSDEYANYIYISYPSLSGIIENSANEAIEITNNFNMTMSSALPDTISATYELKNIEAYETFISQVETMGLDTSIYSVTSMDITNFEQTMVPLDNLSNFTMIFFLVSLIVGGGILVIFNIFSVRERKYEIGVLTAIGMKKSKVALQFLSEIFIITIIAIIIGSGIGAVLSQPVANILLEDQIALIETTANNRNENFGGNFQGGGASGPMGEGIPGEESPNIAGTTGEDTEYIDTINTSISGQVILNLVGISLLLTFVAGSVGLVSILRYDPLEILANRT